MTSNLESNLHWLILETESSDNLHLCSGGGGSSIVQGANRICGTKDLTEILYRCNSLLPFLVIDL